MNWVQWRRDVAFAGYQVNIQMDISAEKMIFGVVGVDPQRRDELIKASLYSLAAYSSPYCVSWEVLIRLAKLTQ